MRQWAAMAAMAAVACGGRTGGDTLDDAGFSGGSAGSIGTGGTSSTGTGGTGGTGGSSGSAGAAGTSVAHCASGTHWTGGATGSALMNPGVPCVSSGCHTPSSKTVLTISGTVYPVAGQHDDNDCNGLDSTMVGAAIAMLDDNGSELGVRLQVNPAGNFFATRPLPPRYFVKLFSQGRESAMKAPVTDGNCNFCHSAENFMGAEGRIVPAAL